MKKIFILLLLCLAGRYAAQYDPAKQRRADSIEKLIPAQSDTALIINCMKLSGYYSPIDRAKSLKYSRMLLHEARIFKGKKWLMGAWLTYLRNEIENGVIDSVVNLYKEALAAAERIEDRNNYCRILIHAASANASKGNDAESIRLYLDAVAYAEKYSEPKIAAMAFNNIGRHFIHKYEWNLALENLRKSLFLKKRDSDLSSIATTYMNAAICFAELKQLDSAKAYFGEASAYAEKNGDMAGLSSINMNLGNIYILEKDYGRAKECYLRSMKLEEELGARESLVTTYSNLASLSLQTGDHQKALEYLAKAEQTYAQQNDLDAGIDIFKIYSEVYADMKDFKKAYEYALKYNKASEKKFHASTAEQIAEMNAKYEADKKQSQIELLNKESAFKSAELVQHRHVSRLTSGIGILFLVLAIALFAGFRNKRKANILLSSLNSKLESSKVEIELQKDVLMEKNKEILSSIHYAQRIQLAQIPSEKLIAKILYRLKKD